MSKTTRVYATEIALNVEKRTDIGNECEQQRL